MPSSSPLYSSLYPAIILLGAGVAGLSLAKLFRISPIVGFFILGALIGTHGLGLVDSHGAGLHFLGELGVCFLLFDVGLHLSLKELRENWYKFLTIGILQFVLVTISLAAIGIGFGLGTEAALILGAIFSLSSTALVLRILADHHELASPVGKKATEVLVFQDVVAIILLVLLNGASITGSLSFSSAVLPLGKMLAAALVVVGIGRILIKPFFKVLLALKNDEVYTAFALLLVLFTSWLTESLGLSLALGAFLGGLALSESSYAYLVRAEIAPFRGLLLSLFFISVGMSLDLNALVTHGGTLLMCLAMFFLFKAVANTLSLQVSGMEKSSASRLGFLLAQGSEFAFVLLASARTAGILDQTTLDLSIAVVGLSLAITPAVAATGCKLSRSMCHVKNEEEVTSDEEAEIIIVQFDDLGRDIAGILESEGIRYRGHDRDVERLTYAKSRGFNVFYSDLNRPRTIGRASTGKVLAVISLVEDDEVVSELVKGLKKFAAHVPIIAATSEISRMELLMDLGVEDTLLRSNDSNTLLPLLEMLFHRLSYPPEKIQAILRRARKDEAEDIFPRLSPAMIEEAALAA